MEMNGLCHPRISRSHIAVFGFMREKWLVYVKDFILYKNPTQLTLSLGLSRSLLPHLHRPSNDQERRKQGPML